ncbi:MAG: hypothetical protein AB1664_07095, partial [Thermodesulfobacteriota bacterium]
DRFQHCLYFLLGSLHESLRTGVTSILFKFRAGVRTLERPRNRDECALGMYRRPEEVVHFATSVLQNVQ